ncbi:MAG TPA: RNA polymerase sigma factor [Bryobacteraceae bacterium]|nr:RNA polymerase sigma factor [Bryobacteraceae bacterium]
MMDAEKRAPTDEELMLRFQKGDSACFGELYKRHFAGTVRACFRWVRDRAEAEDLASETFVAAFDKAKSFEPRSFQGWVLRIARNRCFNRNSSARVRCHEPLEKALHLPVREQPSEAHVAAEELRKALLSLSAKQQLCLKLALEGYSYERIQKETGFSEKAVKSHIQNAREKLKRILKGSRL